MPNAATVDELLALLQKHHDEGLGRMQVRGWTPGAYFVFNASPIYLQNRALVLLEMNVVEGGWE